MRKVNKILILFFLILFINEICSFADSGIVNTTAIRVRKEANTTSEILTNIYEGDKIEILETSGEWCKIKYNAIIGFVKKEFITQSSVEQPTNNEVKQEEPVNAENKPEQEVKEEQIKTTNDNAEMIIEDSFVLKKEIFLKLIPNSASNNRIVLHKDANIKKIDEFGNWIKISDGTVTGWVNKNYLMNIQKEEIAPTENVPVENTLAETKKDEDEAKLKSEEKKEENSVNKVGKINVETAKVREKPSSSATVIEFLDYNDEVTIVSEEGEWYKITNNKISGYVNKKLITIQVSSRGLSENRGNVLDSDKVVEEVKVDETVISKEKNQEISSVLESNSNLGQNVVDYAKQFLGCSYVLGGRDPKTGVDCSGFTKYIFAHFGYTLGNTAASQDSVGEVVSRDKLEIGDLILFYDEGKTKIGHTGIYIGNGEFIHSANPSRGVVIDNLNTNSYYNSRFVTARRIAK